MTDNLQRLRAIFREVFGDPAMRVSEGDSPATIPDWDSVATVRLVLAAEAEFGIRFTTDEVAAFRTVGDILGAIASRNAGG